jgi:hypothetical protein
MRSATALRIGPFATPLPPKPPQPSSVREKIHPHLANSYNGALTGDCRIWQIGGCGRTEIRSGFSTEIGSFEATNGNLGLQPFAPRMGDPRIANPASMLETELKIGRPMDRLAGTLANGQITRSRIR